MIADLRSDTVTRPSPGMRQAMANAEVGDDVLGDDPTVQALERRAAALSGKEAALFTPSGTMANQIAIRCWTQPGDEVLMEAGAHPFNYEAGGPAVIAGVQIRPIPAERGLLDPAAVFANIRPPNDHFAPATLLCVENTSNRGGGSVYPLATLEALHAGAQARGLRVHLDGARAFNAAVALGVPLGAIARPSDSISFCLSKGLGAPVGSLLCGPADWIARARRVRKMLGGGMRQSGVLAAAGLYALEHNVAGLAEDHRRAKALGDGLRKLGFAAPEPETNMLYVAVRDGARAVEDLARAGVLALAVNPTTLRLVTHLDIDDEGVGRALDAFSGLAQSQLAAPA